jgi:septal ring-binding cell division protein DamX
VTPDHARAAVSDTQIVVTPTQPRRNLAAAAAAGLVVGVALGFGLALLTRPDAPVPSVAAASAHPATVQPMPPSPAPPQAAAMVPASTTIPAPAPAPAPATQASVAAPAADTAAHAIEGRTAAGRELLATSSSARYSVQLMATDPREREYLETYLAEAGRLVDPQKLYLVASGSPQSPRVGVLFGAFEARGQAADALGTLPAPLRQFKPYVRSVDALREEARRAQGQ